MKNFRAIRLTVTLSLVVTTMIQSMVGIAAASQCPDIWCPTIGESTSICDGCDRCPVSDEGELCCCCKPKPSGEQPADCPHKSLPDVNDVMSTPEVGATLGICLCGLASSPIDRGQERTRITEQIEPQECDLSAIYDTFLRPQRLVFASPETSLEIGPLPRFSQRMLCVWRI